MGARGVIKFYDPVFQSNFPFDLKGMHAGPAYAQFG